MFFVWIVGVAKIVIDFDCLDDASDSLGAEGGDAAESSRQWPSLRLRTHLVVEISNAFSLSGLGLACHSRLQCGWGCQGESVRGDAAADGGWASDGWVG